MTKSYQTWQSVYRGTAVPYQAFTVNATTDVVTSAAHGLQDEDCVTLTNSGGALPAGFSTNVCYYVISATTNTFKLSLYKGGTAVDITGAGTGTHYYTYRGAQMLALEGNTQVFDIKTSGSFAGTIKFLGSMQPDVNIFLADAINNRVSYEDVNYHDNGLTTGSGAFTGTATGTVGIVVAGTDIHVRCSIDSSLLTWVGVEISGYTAGLVDIKYSWRD